MPMTDMFISLNKQSRITLRLRYFVTDSADHISEYV